MTDISKAVNRLEHTNLRLKYIYSLVKFMGSYFDKEPETEDYANILEVIGEMLDIQQESLNEVIVSLMKEEGVTND